MPEFYLIFIKYLRFLFEFNFYIANIRDDLYNFLPFFPSAFSFVFNKCQLPLLLLLFSAALVPVMLYRATNNERNNTQTRKTITIVTLPSDKSQLCVCASVFILCDI